MTAADALTRLCALADPAVAAGASRFFKSGPDGLPVGDRFVGISAAPLRRLARELRDLPLDQVEIVLRSDIHEARSLALAILTERVAKADDETRKQVYDLYLANTRYVNSWDLVDLSARDLIGAFLNSRSRRPSGASGNIHFSMKTFVHNTGGVADALKSVYTEPALIPASPWLSKTPPPAPQFTRTANALTAAKSAKGVRWYVVRSQSNGKWSVRIVPASSAETSIPMDVWPQVLAVSAVDGFGNESEIVKP